MNMNVQVREAGEMKLVGFEKAYTFATADQIPQLWEEHYLPRQNEIKNWDGCQSLGLCLALPEGEGFTYFAGAVVGEVAEVPAGMTTRTIPARRYAVVTLKGRPLEKIGAAFDFIHKEWLPTSGYACAEDGLSFELYDQRFTNDSDSDNAELDIYVSLK